MKFNIRVLKENDYEDILVGWWKDWKWIPPVKDFLPLNGLGGIMVEWNDIPVCALINTYKNNGYLGEEQNINEMIKKL